MSATTTFGPDQEPKRPILKPIHGIAFRREEAVPVGVPFTPGKFGRLFPVPVRKDVTDASIAALAAAMKDQGDALSADNEAVPAAYTYFGQFIDHDMTFDTTPMPEQIVDPQMTYNFRTPALDLDCLYGLGPAAHPYLYQAANRAKFVLGSNAASADQAGNEIELPGTRQFDLPRNPEGFALIGDPRNDENLIVSQLHLAFLKFHNCVADEIEPNEARQQQHFEEIRRVVTWHYQWLVLHDFLPRIVRTEVLADVLENGRRYYHFDMQPFIPVEFSVAAYRFGHSMIRNNYDHNRVFGPGTNRLAPGSLELLFFFTGPRRTQAIPNGQLVSTPLPSNWVIDWTRFLQFGQRPPTNLSRRFDPLLATALHDLLKNARLDRPPPSLAARNLQRGERVALPTGQNVAARMRLMPLDPHEIAQSGEDGAIAARHGLHEQTPLWYYILKEAQLREEGKRLGMLGSRILAEVFVGLLEGDPLSFRTREPGWSPDFGKKQGLLNERFGLKDMLQFIEKRTPILNPLGGSTTTR